MILWVSDLALLSGAILLLVTPGVMHVVAVLWWLARGWRNAPRQQAGWYWPPAGTGSVRGLLSPKRFTGPFPWQLRAAGEG